MSPSSLHCCGVVVTVASLWCLRCRIVVVLLLPLWCCLRICHGFVVAVVLSPSQCCLHRRIVTVLSSSRCCLHCHIVAVSSSRFRHRHCGVAFVIALSWCCRCGFVVAVAVLLSLSHHRHLAVSSLQSCHCMVV